MPKKIVITGGPSTGKTSLIKYLIKEGHQCMNEISRQVTIEAQKEGIEQLFLTDPLLFSQKLIEGRLKQFLATKDLKKTFLFYDRGLPDVTAYMDFKNEKYPDSFVNICTNNRYDTVFLLPPWKEIYQQDNERYESFEEAQEIYYYLVKGYQKYGYDILEVPTGNVKNRTHFILEKLKII